MTGAKENPTNAKAGNSGLHKNTISTLFLRFLDSTLPPTSSHGLLDTMSSREGVNPLRPYYIPPSAGLSSSADSPPPPPEVASASSAHVFGSSARDLLPDLDYSDYLDSSPSISDWIRDALDRAIWRYTSTLTAQPFDVAKTILQAYAMPDAEEGQWALDGQRDSTPHTRDTSYDDDVCVVLYVVCVDFWY